VSTVEAVPRFALKGCAIFRTTFLTRVYTEVLQTACKQDEQVVVAPGSGITVTINSKIAGLALSALIAFAIGKLFFAPLFFVLWPGLYLAWHFLKRHRKSPQLHAPRSIEGMQSPVVAVTNRPFVLRRVLLVAGAVIVALIAASIFSLYVARESGRRKAEQARSTVHPGMTVADVLRSAKGWISLGATSAAPETDPGHPPAVNFGFHVENNRFTYFDSSNGADRELSESETLSLLHQKLGDGYGWRFRFTFVSATPQHFSFKVEFDKEGRVREVQPVYGWD
jgi:hypothetical protein